MQLASVPKLLTCSALCAKPLMVELSTIMIDELGDDPARGS